MGVKPEIIKIIEIKREPILIHKEFDYAAKRFSLFLPLCFWKFIPTKPIYYLRLGVSFFVGFEISRMTISLTSPKSHLILHKIPSWIVRELFLGTLKQVFFILWNLTSGALTLTKWGFSFEQQYFEGTWGHPSPTKTCWRLLRHLGTIHLKMDGPFLKEF